MANADRSAEQFRKMTETPIPKLILSFYPHLPSGVIQ